MVKVIKGKLNPKQELFCKSFATDRDCFGNGVQAYLKAYSTKKKKVDYLSARVNAHKLLIKTNICERIRELIDIYISAAVVDKELGSVILQYGDLGSKVAAIREYNKVKGRLAATKFKFVDEHEELTEQQLEEEIARRRKLRESGKKPGDKKIKKSS